MAPDCQSAAFFAFVLLFLNAVLVQAQEGPWDSALPTQFLGSPSQDWPGAPSIFPAEAPPPIEALTAQPHAQDLSFPPLGSPPSPPISSPLLAPPPFPPVPASLPLGSPPSPPVSIPLLAPPPFPPVPASPPFSDIQHPLSPFLSDSPYPSFSVSPPSSMASFPALPPEVSTESVTDPWETDSATSNNGKIVLNARQKVAIAFTVLIGLVILSGLCYMHTTRRNNLK